jgi:hypothetical protein
MDIKAAAEWREEANKLIAIEDYKLESAEALERLKYQVDFSQAALRNLQLVNGGAMIALLTFIGNIDGGLDNRSIFWSFVWFGLGLNFGLAAYLGAYLSQSNFMNVAYLRVWEAQQRAKGNARKFPLQKVYQKGACALNSAIALATLNLVGFVVGCLVAVDGLK